MRVNSPTRLTIAVFIFGICPRLLMAQPTSCSYNTYKWNTVERKVVDYQRISHPYETLSDVEIDHSTGCTVCEEDQQFIRVGNLPEVRLCKHIANDVERVLNRLIDHQVIISKLVGYRVGMTRGEIDGEGNRTEFSNHSFGIAIDINDEQNGLYDNCIEIGSECRLRKGGEWIPGQPGSISSDSDIVIDMEVIGLKWGGSILGRQKDFMHFSPTGY